MREDLLLTCDIVTHPENGITLNKRLRFPPLERPSDLRLIKICFKKEIITSSNDIRDVNSTADFADFGDFADAADTVD